MSDRRSEIKELLKQFDRIIEEAAKKPRITLVVLKDLDLPDLFLLRLDFWFDAQAEEEIERRIVEVLRAELSGMTNLWQLESYSVVRGAYPLIEARIREILAGITDPAELIRLHNEAYSAIEPGPREPLGLLLLEEEIAKRILTGSSDVNELRTYLTSSPKVPFDSGLAALIRARIIELLKEQLPGMTDFDELYELWRSFTLFIDMPIAKQLIARRLAEVVPERLETADWKKLEGYWQIEGLRFQAETRMAEILRAVDVAKVEELPDWFMNKLKNPQTLPRNLRREFQRKILALHQQIGREE